MISVKVAGQMRNLVAARRRLGLMAGDWLCPMGAGNQTVETTVKHKARIKIDLAEDVAHRAMWPALERAGHIGWAMNAWVVPPRDRRFMAQTGDVEFGQGLGGDTGRAGMGGSDLPDLPAEFLRTRV